jgi:ATP-dependent Clp protease ATP-binding subunit ClpC
VFERFTDRARRVVVLAQEEARLLNHSYIGTEHILLGLLSEAEGVGAQALIRQNLDLQILRDTVVEVIGRGESFPQGHIPFTPRAKKVLELSLRESLQLGHNYIGTEHIVLGLAREGEGVACQILENAGVGLNRLRASVLELLGPGSGEPMPARALRGSGPRACPHPADELEVKAAEGFRTVRCRRCGLLVGVLPAA